VLDFSLLIIDQYPNNNNNDPLLYVTIMPVTHFFYLAIQD
jgi:hypothetical protein